jgi:hypothetical protein
MSFSGDSWSCVMVDKGPGTISDKIRNTLKASACNLHLQNADRMNISNDICRGVIETSWDSHLIGTRAGILFRATVEADNGDYHVNFLLSHQDLESGADVIRDLEESGAGSWGRSFERFPVPALYQFEDLRKRVFQ